MSRSIHLLLILLMVSTVFADDASSRRIQKSVKDYYASMLTGKVIEWEICFKRCPTVNPGQFTVLRVRGEDGSNIPRGSRLCWVDVKIDEKTKSLPVTVLIHTKERLPVARCDIPSRTVLNDSLIQWIEMDADKLGATRFPDTEQLRDLWSKVYISAGSLVSLPRVSSIPAVKIGEELTLITRKGLVEVVTTGKALQDGIPGQKVNVQYSDNGMKLKGIVQTDGSVIVN